jgi:SNF2 family DNA or RNA helicase
VSGFHVFKLDDSPLWAVKVNYYSAKLNQAARSVPGARWDMQARAQVGYPDAIEQVVARLREMGLRSDDPPENTRQWKHNLPVSYEGAREYQKEGIDFLIHEAGAGALLADDMGCGKSFQAVKAARALRRKTVIVCPAHVRGVWERPADPKREDKGGELAKWWPKANIFKPYGLKADSISPEADVVVIHYDIVHAWVDEILEWSKGEPVGHDDENDLVLYSANDLTLIFDEAHVLLNPTSRRSKACHTLAAAARGRIALTGTPPTDRARDLYNIVETISPGRFGEFFPFGIRYCGGHKIDVTGPENTTKTVWDFGGKSNLKELRQRLNWFCLRRTKREVLKELPALQRQVVDFEVPAKNRVGMSARIVGDKRLMRAALDNAADGKLKGVLDLVRGHLAAGQRVVVGTYRRAVCEKIATILSEVAPTKFVHGGIPIPRRSKIIDELRRSEGACCLVANIDCASTGIDLTFAGVVVMGELVWEPRDLVQFEARVHRFGASTSEPVIVQYVIARGTGDELVLQAVINKLDNFLDLVETDAGDGLKETLKGKDDGLSRLAGALKKMGKKAT